MGELSKRIIVGLATSVTPYYRDEGVPILRNLNIKDNYLDDTDILYLEKSYAESQISKQIHTGDVLTVHTGYIGTSCVVPEKYDNCLTFTTLITTTDEHTLKSAFLAQYLNSEIGMRAVQAVTTQGGRQNLNTNDFVKVEIAYPSLPEQEKICEILNHLDDLITLHQYKCNPQVEPQFKKKAILWEQRKLKDLCALFTDGDWIESKDQSESGVRLVQTGNVGVTEYLDKPSNKKWVSYETFERLHCKEVKSGDILISRLPEPAGRACIMPNIGQKMITAVDCTIARIDSKYCPEYIVQYLSTQTYFDKVNNCLAGGTRQRISRGNLSSFLIPLLRTNKSKSGNSSAPSTTLSPFISVKVANRK